ncbi:glycosyl transferase family 90 [Wenyingzhuangia fucanilytica]|nr:glycosyl transferase family 90 [Wenyingzhuangia fucanilytica]
MFLDLMPSAFFSKNKKKSSLNIKERIDYYNQLSETYNLGKPHKLSKPYFLTDTVSIAEFKRPKKLKTYYFDLMETLRFFPETDQFCYEFGDITEVPYQPTFVKSRPIEGDNTNAVLLKLNKIRHFKFVKDNRRFLDKKDMLIGRSRFYHYHHNKVDFYNKYFNHPMCDLGAVNSPEVSAEWSTPKLSIKEHLKYKFVLSLEGNDVATNLKWIMSSNSIAVSPKLKYETWFMEGTLIPDVHFICIKDDYSDLEEKLQYYIEHPDKALKIIENANKHVKQFNNLKKERAVAFGVVDKYFTLQER